MAQERSKRRKRQAGPVAAADGGAASPGGAPKAARAKRLPGSPAAMPPPPRGARQGKGNSGAADRVQQGSLKFDIPSDLTAARDVQQQVMDAVHAAGYSENAVFAVKLSLEEALVNAIRHGNKLNPAKRVKIHARVDAKQVEITIEDQGPGFNRANVPDPTAEENLTKCSGRGLLLMEAYMNKVEYSDNGRKVRLVKLNDDA